MKHSRAGLPNSSLIRDRTLEDRVLWLLHATYPAWTPAPALARISLQYNARIFSLRRKGWQIANRVEYRDGKRFGYFRLAAPGTLPNPQRSKNQSSTSEASMEASSGDGSLFGDLAPDRSYHE